MGALIAIAACCLIVPIALGVYGAVTALAGKARRKEEVDPLTTLRREELERRDV